MMGKMLLSKAEADAIKKLRESRYTNKSILKLHFTTNQISEDVVVITEMDTDTLVKALYMGYEVELTPEEKIATIYKIHRESSHHIDRYFADGIKKTLQILDIKIKGVND